MLYKVKRLLMDRLRLFRQGIYFILREHSSLQNHSLSIRRELPSRINSVLVFFKRPTEQYVVSLSSH